MMTVVLVGCLTSSILLFIFLYVLPYDLTGGNKKKPTRMGFSPAASGVDNRGEKQGEEGTPTLFTDKDYL